MSTTFVLKSFSQHSRVCMCLCSKKSEIKIIMINSNKISIHRFIATALFRVVKEWPQSSGNIHE